MGTVMEIESSHQWKAALKSAKSARMLTFVMFYVPRSKACKSIGRTFIQLASQYAQVVFLKVDVTKNRRIEQKYNIDQVPTFIVYRGERLVEGLFKPSRRELVALAARWFATSPKPAAAPLPVANDPSPVNTSPTPVAANLLHAEGERAKADLAATALADPHIIGKPIEIESILQWNTFLTPTTNNEQLVLVQFYSPANRECKSITPTFTQLAAQYPRVTFLRVNAIAEPGTPIAQSPGSAIAQSPGAAIAQSPGTAIVQSPGAAIAQSPGAAIAKKYKVDTLPFFWLFSGGLPVDGMMGSDALSLRELAARRFGAASARRVAVTSTIPSPGVAPAIPSPGVAPAIPSPGVAPAIPVEADIAKAQGNGAFAVGDYTQAAAHYTRAVELAPGWAVPRANRALAYMNLIGEDETGMSDAGTEEGAHNQSKDLRNELRPRAMEDAYMATILDERWGKGWVRLAQVMLMEGEVEAVEKREEGVRKMLEGAQAALYNAVALSDGRVLKEAQQMMEDVTARLKAL